MNRKLSCDKPEGRQRQEASFPRTDSKAAQRQREQKQRKWELKMRSLGICLHLRWERKNIGSSFSHTVKPSQGSLSRKVHKARRRTILASILTKRNGPVDKYKCQEHWKKITMLPWEFAEQETLGKGDHVAQTLKRADILHKVQIRNSYEII